MKKLLFIGNKENYIEDNLYENSNYVKKYIDDNIDIVVRYNNCNNANITGYRTDILFLNANTVFLSYYKDKDIDARICNSLRKLYISNKWNNYYVTHPNEISPNYWGIPKNIWDNKHLFSDSGFHYKDILPPGRSQINLKMVSMALYNIIHEYAIMFDIYIYGIDVTNRDKIDKYTQPGQFHYLSDKYETEYFQKLLNEHTVHRFEDLLDNKHNIFDYNKQNEF